MKCPCTKDCARRNGYICRRTCVEFIEYEKNYEKDLAEKRRLKKLRTEVEDFKIENLKKAKKKKWRKNKR